MNWLTLTYRQIFTLLLLSAYLIGNFSMPVFEGVHFIMHLGDNKPRHSFQDHHAGHNHQVIMDLNDLITEGSSKDNSTSPPSIQKYKKLAHPIVEQADVLIHIELHPLSNFFFPTDLFPVPKYSIEN